MKKAILATKVGMTQIFNDEGVLVPVDVYKRQAPDWICEYLRMRSPSKLP